MRLPPAVPLRVGTAAQEKKTIKVLVCVRVCDNVLVEEVIFVYKYADCGLIPGNVCFALEGVTVRVKIQGGPVINKGRENQVLDTGGGELP